MKIAKRVVVITILVNGIKTKKKVEHKWIREFPSSEINQQITN